MKTLLLTGGTGYIGSHNAVVFLEAGYDVIIFDNLSNSDQNIIKYIEDIISKPLPEINKNGSIHLKNGVLRFYEGDLRNKADIEQIFATNKIDGVIHFAGAKAVGESCDKPFYYYENNIVGSLNLFKVMEQNNCKNIIFSSSATVYDPQNTPPFTELDKTGGTTNPYGTTKFIIENILRDLSTHKNFNVINLRYFNPVGAYKFGYIGENPSDIPNNLLPFIIKVANGELSELLVYGDDYNTPDGTGVRDYIHVLDLADGHLAGLEYLQSHSHIYEEINLGTGKGTSVLEMIQITESIIQETIPYKIVPRRSGDIASAYCCPDKAQKLLGWKAKLSVREAIEDSWNYVQRST